MALNVTLDQVKAIVDGQAEQAGADRLITALHSGLLELHPFDVARQGTDVARQFFLVIGDAISDGSMYPLFDDSTGELVQVSINEGK